MSIYDINYQTVINNLLPPQYRVSKIKAFLYSLVSPIQWLRDKFFDNYVNSDIYFYTDLVSNTFIKYAYTLVRFPDNTVWETQVDNVDITLFNPMIGQTTDNGVIIWVKVLDNFIGLNERAKFSNQKLMLEYLLNRYFKLDTGPDLIYIDNNDTAHPMFSIGEEYDDTAVISELDEDTLFWISLTDQENQENNFTIYVPTLISMQLGVNYESIISVIVDRYNFESLNYNVVVY